jgi:hypothetical protein
MTAGNDGYNKRLCGEGTSAIPPPGQEQEEESPNWLGARIDAMEKQGGFVRKHEARIRELEEALRLVDGFLLVKGYSDNDPLVRGAIKAALAGRREVDDE